MKTLRTTVIMVIIGLFLLESGTSTFAKRNLLPIKKPIKKQLPDLAPTQLTLTPSLDASGRPMYRFKLEFVNSGEGTVNGGFFVAFDAVFPRGTRTNSIRDLDHNDVDIILDLDAFPGDPGLSHLAYWREDSASGICGGVIKLNADAIAPAHATWIFTGSISNNFVEKGMKGLSVFLDPWEDGRSFRYPGIVVELDESNNKIYKPLRTFSPDRPVQP